MKLRETCLSAVQLREILNYDKLTGIFTWKTKGAGRCLDKPAGNFTSDGYHRIGIHGKYFQSHRLAWLWITGEWPKEEIDHINGISFDNSFRNLREATRTTNRENIHKARSDNKSGFLGVDKDKRHSINPWRAFIRVAGKRKFLGTFATPEEAHEAYIKAKRQLHKGCTI